MHNWVNLDNEKQRGQVTAPSEAGGGKNRGAEELQAEITACPLHTMATKG